MADFLFWKENDDGHFLAQSPRAVLWLGSRAKGEAHIFVPAPAVPAMLDTLAEHRLTVNTVISPPTARIGALAG